MKLFLRAHEEWVFICRNGNFQKQDSLNSLIMNFVNPSDFHYGNQHKPKFNYPY